MSVEIMIGEALAELGKLADSSVHMIVTSPPYYGLRDYGTGQWEGGDPLCEHIERRIRIGDNMAKFSAEHFKGGGHKAGREQPIRFAGECGHCGAQRLDGQIGLEASPREYLDALAPIFAECFRVLRDDGTLWLNIGDSYAANGGLGGQGGNSARAGRRNVKEQRKRESTTPPEGWKAKDMIGIPWRLAFMLQDQGWYLRQDIIWAKPNTMPESARDRCTKAHEYLFLLAKSPRYYFDAAAIAEPLAGSAKTSSGNLARKPPEARGAPALGEGAVAGSIPWEGSDRNKRSVWTIPTESFGYEMCSACEAIYSAREHLDLRRKVEVESETGARTRLVFCRCGRHDAWLTHFATFPPALIEPAILAGTSAKGCCSACGAPWEREIEREFIPQGDVSPERAARLQGQTDPGQRWEGSTRGSVARSTKGWRASCRCEAGVEPCTVLDPFGGAGTTALVADRLQRRAILIELNPKYAAMARRRIDDERGPMHELMAVAP